MRRTLALPLVAALAVGGAADAQTVRQRAAANFAAADANDDGTLTLSEFTVMIDLNAAHGIGRAARVKRLGLYDTAFARLDLDANGRVTPAEIAAVARQAAR